jgi:hypothetical protein
LDAFERLVLRIGKLPADVTLARDHRAGVLRTDGSRRTPSRRGP